MELTIPDISFIILSWNSAQYLKWCLDSIVAKCSEERLPYEIIVIDNGSSDSSVAIMRDYEREDPTTFRLLSLDRNGGTTYSRNLGLKISRGNFLCILDSDTELGSGRLKEIIHQLGVRKKVGIVAPCLILPDGSVQNSVKRFPTLWHKLIKIPKILFGIRTRNADFYEDFPFNGKREVDTAISACWIFHRDLLETVGYLDEKIFYSPEDLDYSHRVRKAGYSILYYPNFRVLHHTQQISHKKPFSKTSLSHLGGLLYYYHKHGGWILRPEFIGLERHDG
jgi:GT2 family glycosyltransferase